MINFRHYTVKKGKFQAALFVFILGFSLFNSDGFAQLACHTPVDGPFFDNPWGATTIPLDSAKKKGVCYSIPPGSTPITLCYSFVYPASGSVMYNFIVSTKGCDQGTCLSTSGITVTAGYSGCIRVGNACAKIQTYDATCGFVLDSMAIGTGCPNGSFVPGHKYVVCVYIDKTGCSSIDVCPVINCTSGKCANPCNITLSTSTTNVKCTGGNTGTASVTASAGVAPYTYSWSGGGGTASTASGLTAGVYTVTVTDNTGCSKTSTVSVAQSATLLSANITANIPVTCKGSANGSLTVSQTGGTAPYTYSWSPSGGTGSTATGLNGGTYTVSVTDTYGCVKTATAVVKESTTLLATSITTNVPVTCKGSSNGSLTASQTGGTSAYTYSWSPLGGTTVSATGLSGGIYTVSVTDAYGCVKTATATVKESATLLATSITTNVSVTCKGSANGSLGAGSTGGTSPYTYSWSPSGGTGSSASGLNGGAYTVSVTDAYGCVKTASATVLESAVLLSATITTNVPVTCKGSSNGSLTATQTGGTSAYTYSWSSSGGTASTATGLSGGTYTVGVTDAYGCVKTATATVKESTALLAAGIITNVPVTCKGSANGSLLATQTGGTSAYTYSWSPSGGTGSTATGLSGGTYTVSVTDAYGCIKTATATVQESSALLSASITTNIPVTCKGSSNGSLTATQTGGTAAYTYFWSPSGRTTISATGLSGGTYTVSVTDAYGCVKTVTATVLESTTLLAANITTNIPVTCKGNANGSLTVSGTGGTTAYTYSWSPSAGAGSTATGLSGGTYTVSVTDAYGCVKTTTATVKESTVLLSPVISVNVPPACAGNSNGSLTVNPNGGTSPFTYQWSSGGANSATTSGLIAGTYTVTVTDVYGCVKTTTAIITDPPVLSLTTSQINVACSGGNNGSATAIPAGGTGAYSYLWNNGQTASTATGLSSGAFTVTVTDSKGCAKSTVVTITQSGTLNGTTSLVNVSCYGLQNGSIGLITTGGTSPYTYNWSNGSTTKDISGLVAGNYTVTITDKNGCLVAVNATITEPAVLTSSIVSENVACYADSSGSIDLTVTGGTLPYSFNWSNAGTTEDLNGLKTGTYTVTVTDKNGCITQTAVTIDQPLIPIQLSTTSTSVTCKGSGDGTANVFPIGGTPPYAFQWSPIGGTSPMASGLPGGIYTITVIDSLGCFNKATINVNESAALLSASVTGNKAVTCKGGNDGTATISASNGMAPYTYSWLPTSGTGNAASGLSGGIYTVIVSDSYGCITTLTIQVNESKDALTANMVATDADCSANNGTATVITTGGTGLYTYVWTPNVSSTSSATALYGGSYAVTVTDQYGCTSTSMATVKASSSVNAGFIPSPVVGSSPLTVDFINTSTGANSYVWYFGDGEQDTTFNVKHTYENKGNYTVKLVVRNIYGCVDSIIYTYIKVTEKSFISVPNVFTPNGDNQNDKFYITSKGLLTLWVEIYNRWGMKLYEYDTINGGWDGRTMQGTEAPDGTYYYILKAEGEDGELYNLTGFLTLIK